MSFSRDRQEYAQQHVANAAAAGDVSDACVGCKATYDMSVAAMLTDRGSMEIEGAGNVASGYVALIAGCAGEEACKGTAFFPPEAGAAAAGAQIIQFPLQQ